MKASELIKRLQELVDEHGDWCVEAADTYYGDDYYNSIVSVRYSHEELLIDIYE